MTGFLKGRLALVTGGSRGLGRSICLALAKEGAKVAFTYSRSEPEASELEETLRGMDVPVWSFKASVTDKAATQEMVRELSKQAGPIDILINNAGVGQVVPLALMEEEDWDRMMNINVKGAFLTSQAVLRGMIHQKRGRILNISSLAGVKMMQAPVHYSAAKAALKGLTEALAKEVGRYGVTVNCLAPGVLSGGVSGNLPPAKQEEYLRNCALGRVGTFDEIADVASYLVDRNSYMNGATIVLDGAV